MPASPGSAWVSSAAVRSRPPLRLAVVGDSLAAGVVDVGRDARQPTFADHLAAGVRATGRPVELTSTAWPGADAADGVARQVPGAVAARPDVAFVWLGLNDLLRLTFDAEEVADGVAASCAALATAGARVATASMPLPTDALPFRGWGLRRIGDRVTRLNDAIAARSAAAGHLHLDVRVACHDLAPRDLVGVDGIHLSALSHRRVAAEYARLLEAEGMLGAAARDAVDGLVGEEWDGAAAPTRREQTAWVMTRGASYAARRLTGLTRRVGAPGSGSVAASPPPVPAPPGQPAPH